MFFQDGAIISFEFYDSISHPILESGTVKEGGISYPLFNRVNSGFLLPKTFFLFTSLIEVKQYIILFSFKFIGVPNIHDAMLHISSQLMLDGFLIFENVSKGTFIPFMKVRPENPKLLMHDRHFGTSSDLHTGPPFFHSTIKFCMF